MVINKFNYEVYALDYLEGTLSPELVVEMERFLQANPVIEAELSEMKELVLVEPDETIVFEHKADLYKKEEGSIFQMNWRKSLSIAASIALLLFTYSLGYQSGQKEEMPVAVIEQHIPKTIENIAEKKGNEEPILKEEKKIEPIKEIILKPKNTIVKSPKKTIIKPILNRQPIPFVELIKEPVVIANTVSNHPAKINKKQQELIQAIEKELVGKESIAAENVATLTTSAIPTLPIIDQNLMPLESSNDTLNDLSKALQASLNITQEKLAVNTKKKRKFKDLLGKFPVNNLKEALIPTFYRDEPAGQ